MQRDIRDRETYKEAERLFTELRQPGTGSVSDALEICASPDGESAVYAGVITERLEGTLKTRICCVDLGSGETRILTFGPNSDRLPKYSPDGRSIAFLSDRKRAGDFQLHLLDPITGAARRTAAVEGWVEYFHWAPSGRQILLGVAGHGAVVSGGQGGVTTRQPNGDRPSWMPRVETGDEAFWWRRLWIYDCQSGHVYPVGPADSNVWEGTWCGNNLIAAVVSPGPGEGLWYTATLHIVDFQTGHEHEVYRPHDQLGVLAASPSGKQLAFVEAICGRGIVAGDLRLLDTDSGRLERVETQGVSIAHAEWRSDRHLLLGGHRSFETVVGVYDLTARRFCESWVSDDLTTGGRYISASGLNLAGDCVLVGENYVRAPEIAAIRDGEYRAVKSFGSTYTALTRTIEAIEKITWTAPDGLEIEGWLLRPRGAGPYPLVMYIHGGPTSHWRPVWLGRNHAFVMMLLSRGYAVFYPNPRGSSGRGRAFVRHVVGDMGGADTYDLLSGIDALIERGIADRARLGVTGGSYGGFMASWLITQDTRFSAAVASFPVTNWVTEHLVSFQPEWVASFLADKYTNPNGKYFSRSPVMHAAKAVTPTLNICGALDRCTPPEEAAQFHTALREHGVKSVLVTYPLEGHGVRGFPAAIDYAARVVGWFDEHISS
jgi:dipeptidyl aminopeptidase/acylaminoacyl peptidase